MELRQVVKQTAQYTVRLVQAFESKVIPNHGVINDLRRRAKPRGQSKVGVELYHVPVPLLDCDITLPTVVPNLPRSSDLYTASDSNVDGPRLRENPLNEDPRQLEDEHIICTVHGRDIPFPLIIPPKSAAGKELELNLYVINDVDAVRKSASSTPYSEIVKKIKREVEQYYGDQQISFNEQYCSLHSLFKVLTDTVIKLLELPLRQIIIIVGKQSATFLTKISSVLTLGVLRICGLQPVMKPIKLGFDTCITLVGDKLSKSIVDEIRNVVYAKMHPSTRDIQLCAEDIMTRFLKIMVEVFESTDISKLRNVANTINEIIVRKPEIVNEAVRKVVPLRL